MIPASSLIVVPLLACGSTIILHCMALRYFPRWKLLDTPERYGHARPPIPYPTGVIAIIIFLLFFVLTQPIAQKETGVIVSIVLLAIMSFIDDRTPLPSVLRLCVQIGICFLLFATGSQIYTITNPFEMLGAPPFLKLDSLRFTTVFFGPLPVMSGLFTILWLGLTMNALNWFDGIPGQVSVLSAIGFLMLGLLAVSDRVGQPVLALIAFALFGISIASLVFDFPPPKALMGDSGSMFFGLMLGLLGIYQGGKVATAFLVLGIPLFDAMFVVARRLLHLSSPFKGNRDHLHHRLLKKGWSERTIVIVTALTGASFGIAALFMSTTQKGMAVIVLFLLMLALAYYTRSPSS